MVAKINILLAIIDDIIAIILATVLLLVLVDYEFISTITAFFVGIIFTIFFGFVAYETCKVQFMKPKVGYELMVGKKGEAVSELDPLGLVYIEGEYWKAIGNEPIKKGDTVQVIDIEGLKTIVVKIEK